jgi:hypothetical protein
MTLEEYFAAWNLAGMSFDEKLSLVSFGFLVLAGATGYAGSKLMRKRKRERNYGK